MEIRTELYCHECNNYVQFTLDDELNGNHVITCPKCGHEHCRVIKDGMVTSERFDSRNQNVFYASTITYTVTSSELVYSGATTAATGTSGSFLYGSWMNTT